MDWDKPPTLRFWVCFFAVIATMVLAIAIVVLYQRTADDQDPEKPDPMTWEECVNEKLGTENWRDEPSFRRRLEAGRECLPYTSEPVQPQP